MRIARSCLWLALAGLIAASCVRPGAIAPHNGGRYIISEEELSQVADLSVYDAVRKLRPHFLRSRAVSAEGRPGYPLMLYVDGDRRESLDDLRHLSVAEVQEVRFYEPQLANTYFGRYNNAGGAIAVTLKPLP